MVLLNRLHSELPFYYGFDCQCCGPCSRKGCCIKDVEYEGGPSNRVGFRDCLLVARGVNYRSICPFLIISTTWGLPSRTLFTL